MCAHLCQTKLCLWVLSSDECQDNRFLATIWSVIHTFSMCNIELALSQFERNEKQILKTQRVVLRGSLLEGRWVFFNSSAVSLLYGPALTSIHCNWKTIALTIWTFVGKAMSLLFKMLSRFVIAFLPRSRHLLISGLLSPSAVIMEPKKVKSVTTSVTYSYDITCPSLLKLCVIYQWRDGGWDLRGGAVVYKGSEWCERFR